MYIIESKDVDNYIERIFELLRKQKYQSLGIELTREERKRLFDFFCIYSEYGIEDYKFKKLYRIKTEEDLNSLNKCAYEQADDELKRIITKCKSDPKKIFLINNGICNIDNNIKNAMYNNGILEIGDYKIEVSYDHPIDRNSEEITHFLEEFQEKKYLRAKDGEACFIVYKNTNGNLEEIYRHKDDIQFGGYISFMEKQIGGNFGMRGFSFNLEKGMMFKEIGRSECINELMPFFYQFESLLCNNLNKGKYLKLSKEE